MRLVQSIRVAAAVGIALTARPAGGQPLAATDRRPPSRGDRPQPAAPVEQPQAPQRHTARSVAGAPRPDRVDGVARPEQEDGGGRRALARALLVVPRIAFWVVNAPVRAGYWVKERYQVPLRVRQALFDPAGNAGVLPLAWYESGFGAGGGARFLHRDLAGRGEHLVADVSYGGRVEPGAALRGDTGERLGDRFRLGVAGAFEERPRERFFGIGDADDPAVDTRFAARLAAVGATGELRIAGPLAARVTSEARWRRVDPPDEAPGLAEDRATSYHQLELAIDTRDRPARAEPPGPRATGVALSILAGAVTDPVHARVGGEARAHLPLGSRQRILVLRALADGVSGPLADIPLLDLPALGGALDLRGYPAGRFRDRARALASAEYRFDLGDSLGAFLFADAGRVLATPGDLSGGLRAGYGGGLDLRRGEHQLGRLSLASSIDGGFLVSLAFDPMGEPEGRR